MNLNDMGIFDRIAQLAQLSAVLEVISPKPGNVNPMHEFHDTRFEDFIIGAIAIAPTIRNSAINGYYAGVGRIRLSDIGIGKNIRLAVKDVMNSHSGGNTHLGIAMLLVPMASSAGIAIAEGKLTRDKLRDGIMKVIAHTTVDDSLEFYRAIEISGTKALGKLNKPRVPFYRLMEISAKKDRNAEELSNGMQIILNLGLSKIEEFLNKTGSLRDSITMTYLEILSRYPDTFIARKMGIETARMISKRAKLILESGGILNENGIKEIEEFDSELRKYGNKLNPGTTADMVTASLFAYLLLETL